MKLSLDLGQLTAAAALSMMALPLFVPCAALATGLHRIDQGLAGGWPLVATAMAVACVLYWVDLQDTGSAIAAVARRIMPLSLALGAGAAALLHLLGSGG